MSRRYITVRVHFVYDLGAWYATTDRAGQPPVPLAATDRPAAQAEAETRLAALGLNSVSDWTAGSDDEIGSQAVFAEPGSGDATKALLASMWSAHRALLAKLGVTVSSLPAGQRALLFSQDVMLVGLAKILVDRGVLTEDDITAACSSVQAADFSWLTGL